MLVYIVSMASYTETSFSIPRQPLESLKAFVTIAHFGVANRAHLLNVLKNWDAIPFGRLDILLLCTDPFESPPFSRIHLETCYYPKTIGKNLPAEHRAFVLEKINNYDLFGYSEDDIRISETNVQAFLHFSSLLPLPFVPGFLRFEQDSNGEPVFIDTWINGGHLPVIRKRLTIAGTTCLKMANEHQGCYLLTRDQLTFLVKSQKFPFLTVRPIPGQSGFFFLNGGYGMLEAAATSIFAPNGLSRVIIIGENIMAFAVEHLSGRYAKEMRVQAARHEFMRPSDFSKSNIDRWMRMPWNGQTILFWCYYYLRNIFTSLPPRNRP